MPGAAAAPFSDASSSSSEATAAAFGLGGGGGMASFAAAGAASFLGCTMALCLSSVAAEPNATSHSLHSGVSSIKTLEICEKG